MRFKIYYNRKTRHPSISLKSGDKKYWHNLEVSHHLLKNERYIEVFNVGSKDDEKLQDYANIFYRHFLKILTDVLFSCCNKF